MKQARAILAGAALALLAALPVVAHAAEHVTLRNGFELDCTRQESVGDRVRLYLLPSPGDPPTASNFLEVSASAIVSSVPIADPPAATCSLNSEILDCHPDPEQREGEGPAFPAQAALTAAELHQLLKHAGAAHNIDADLLAAVVHAESAGQPHAVSRAGAQGLMQLMPATASTLGVSDTFAPDQNIRGGAAYLDQLLTRYHDNIALALAAYNAGPAAVDRYHGIPPFAETRAYVARVIREFNRRKLAVMHVPVLAASR